MESKKNIVIGILVVLLLCSVGLIVYLFVDKSNSVNNEQKEEVVENKIEELDVNDELVQNLYNKINVFNHITDTNEYFGYIFKEKLLASDIDNKVRLYMAAAANDYVVYDKAVNVSISEIEKSLKDIFGDINFENENFAYGLCNTVEYDLLNTYTFNEGGCGITAGAPNFITKLTKAIKNDKDIELYQMMFYKDNNLPFGDIFQRKGGIKISTIPYDEKLINEGQGANYRSDEIFEQYKDKLDTYKYTFKYNEEDDKYYFYSVERTQK